MNRSTWRNLLESTEGPNVTVQIPREWAEELLRALAAALEVDDMGDEPDMMGMPHMEPDEDDLSGGIPGLGDGDDDDLGSDLDFGGDADVPAGDDDDSEDDDSEDEDDDEDDEDEDDTDEAVELDGSGSQPRPQTALGESAFARLAKKIVAGDRGRAKKAVPGRRR